MLTSAGTNRLPLALSTTLLISNRQKSLHANVLLVAAARYQVFWTPRHGRGTRCTQNIQRAAVRSRCSLYVDGVICACELQQAADDPRFRLCRGTDGTGSRRSCERILYGLLYRRGCR